MRSYLHHNQKCSRVPGKLYTRSLKNTSFFSRQANHNFCQSFFFIVLWKGYDTKKLLICNHLAFLSSSSVYQSIFQSCSLGITRTITDSLSITGSCLQIIVSLTTAILISCAHHFLFTLSEQNLKNNNNDDDDDDDDNNRLLQ